MAITHTRQIEFGLWGGAELFFADIDGDGTLEVLAYQGPGVFGAGMYRNWPYVAAAFPSSVCVTAFRQDGTRLWTFGEPNPGDRPYLAHAHESCVAVGDANGDGVAEVALADGDRVLLLDGPTGAVRAEARLPEDNFYIVQILGQKVSTGEAALVAKNGEGGYGTWHYGEPLIGFSADLDAAWDPVGIPGAGHHILSLDLDRDGRNEYLVGYCMVKPGGAWQCLVDAIDPESVDADRDHTDYQDLLWLASGEYALGFAGSSTAYLALTGGRTLFARPDTHVQGCCLGRFRPDSPYQMAVYNDDGPMVLYDPGGTELWRLPIEERWPLGMPESCAGHRFHRSRPIVKLSSGDQDHVLFTDGGWPWVMDGDGVVTAPFEPPARSVQPEASIPTPARADDLGYGFATQIVDWHGDGNPEVVIYDRRYLWSFPYPAREGQRRD